MERANSEEFLDAEEVRDMESLLADHLNQMWGGGDGGDGDGDAEAECSGDAADIEEDIEEDIVVENPADLLPEPAVGMEFNSAEEIIHFFDEYSVNSGYGWRQHELKNRRGEVGQGADTLRLFCCREGVYVSKAKNPNFVHRSQRCGCKAHLNAHRHVDEAKWVITTFDKGHNHEPDPGNVKYHASNKHMTAEEERMLRLTALAGIPLCKAYALMALEKGVGVRGMNFTVQDARNRMNRIRRNWMSGGDYAAFTRYMHRMAAADPNFYAATDIGDDGRLRNAFWCDGRSREAYKDFGDVISFDATYSKNRYKMPFCPFIGVNHHGQSTLLGCALITSESTRDFTWVFKQFLNCMDGVAPKGIITDQARGMAKAIEDVLIGTAHRLCVFHIMQNGQRQFGRRGDWKQLRRRLTNVIHYTITAGQFERSWRRMLDDFDIWENEWVKSVYEIQERWVPLYFKKQFWAGMSSTQRSEGINNFFKKFFNKQTTMIMFVENFNLGLAQRIDAEERETFRMNDAPIRPKTEHEYEGIGVRVYTRMKFVEFQNELVGTAYCYETKLKYERPGWEKYSLRDRSHRCTWLVAEGMKFYVFYVPASREVFCDCKMFEYTGILCRHALRILQRKGGKEFPMRYVLSRWRKDVTRNYVKFDVADYSSTVLGAEPLLYRTLRCKFEEAVLAALASPAIADEMQTFLEGVAARGKLIGDRVEGIDVVDAGAAGKVFRRNRNVCPLPLPVETLEMEVDDPTFGGRLHLPPGADPVVKVRGGKQRNNRVGYYPGRSNWSKQPRNGGIEYDVNSGGEAPDVGVQQFPAGYEQGQASTGGDYFPGPPEQAEPQWQGDMGQGSEWPPSQPSVNNYLGPSSSYVWGSNF